MLVEIDASHPAASGGSEVHGGTAGAAADFQDVAVRVHECLVGKAKPVASGHPTALTDVLTKGVMADFSFSAAAEVRVDVVIEIHRFGHAVPCSYRRRVTQIDINATPKRLPAAAPPFLRNAS